MEGLLTLLKLVFVAALYLFLWRVVRTVYVEMKPAPAVIEPPVVSPNPAPQVVPAGTAVIAKGTVALVILAPSSRAGEVVPVEAELTIGRAPGCQIALADDTTVSSLHARVAPDRKGVTVEDLGSTNGTYVNGKKISAPTKAKRGAQIQCGNAAFEVVT